MHACMPWGMRSCSELAHVYAYAPTCPMYVFLVATERVRWSLVVFTMLSWDRS